MILSALPSAFWKDPSVQGDLSNLTSVVVEIRNRLVVSVGRTRELAIHVGEGTRLAQGTSDAYVTDVVAHRNQITREVVGVLTYAGRRGPLPAGVARSACYRSSDVRTIPCPLG